MDGVSSPNVETLSTGCEETKTLSSASAASRVQAQTGSKVKKQAAARYCLGAQDKPRHLKFPCIPPEEALVAVAAVRMKITHPPPGVISFPSSHFPPPSFDSDDGLQLQRLAIKLAVSKLPAGFG